MGELDGVPLILSGQLKLVCKRVALFLYSTPGLDYSQLLRSLDGVKLGLQFLNLSFLGRRILLRFDGGIRLGEIDGIQLIL